MFKPRDPVPKLILFTATQGSLRWAVLLPVAATGSWWPGVDLDPVGVFRHEAQAVPAMRELDARLRREMLVAVPSPTERT